MARPDLRELRYMRTMKDVRRARWLRTLALACEHVPRN